MKKSRSPAELLEGMKHMSIQFVSYDGSFPNLCSGILELQIEGRVVTFGNRNNCDYQAFWFSSGGCDNYEPFEGDWCVVEKMLPDFLKPYSDVLAEILNENIPKGCCGGCI